VNELLNAIFGLRDLGFGDPDVEFAFARAFPSWVWILGALLAVALCVWGYRRMDGGRAARGALVVVRTSLLLVLLLILAGPQLIRPNVRVEKDWVLVLVDRSASLGVRDVSLPNGERGARDEQLRRTIQAGWPTWEQVVEDKRVLWLGFDSVASELQVTSASSGAVLGLDLGEPDGRRTAIGAAVDQALQLVTARPVSALVVLSDGRSVDEPSRRAMRRLRAERIPVFTVALGADTPLGDLVAADVEAPEAAFVGDDIPVRVSVERRGSASRGVEALVRLTDEATGLVIDEQRVTLPRREGDSSSAQVTLRAKPGEPGTRRWRVTVVPDTPDLVAENNSTNFAITLVDRPLRVLYLDGYPRWEARYLRSLFLRERSVESSGLLLSSRRRYLQEGDVILDRLPLSPEEWAPFDVIILGDLPAELFSFEQLMQMRDHVADRGAGLLWIGGPSATPGSWAETPLADLLPFRLSAGGGLGAGRAQLDAYLDPVLMRRAPDADRLGLLDLADEDEGWPALLDDPRTRWAKLWYAQRIDATRLKPAVEVLATVAPVGPVGLREEEATPAVMSMRYGAGRVVYVATDETWRWRYGRGETLHERFWIPLIRYQARERLAQSDRSAVLEVAPRTPTVGRPTAVRLRLLDQGLLDQLGPRTTIRIDPADPDALLPSEELVVAQAGGPRERLATWIPRAAGRFVLTPSDPALADVSTEITVVLDDDEMRRPETNFELLASLSAETGGAFLRPEDYPELPERLPRRELTITGEPDVEPLWDRPVVLLLVLTLAGVEWIGRRLMRLA